MDNYKVAIQRTWETIAPDVLAMEQEMGNSFAKQDLIIEMVLDANRVEEYGDLSKEDLAGWLCLDYKERFELAKSCLPKKEWI